MRLRCLIPAFLILTQVSGQAKPGTLKIYHLTGNFYIYVTHSKLGDSVIFPSNSMYLVTNKGAVLFDTPWDSAAFQPLLDSIYSRHHKKPILCISTHSHADRTAGLEFYKLQGIITYTTTRTDEISKQRNEKRAARLISGDTTFSIGGYRFQVYYPGEGHSPDNIVIWFDKEKILYGGCLIKSTETNNLGNLADANLNAWPNTLKKLQLKFREPRYIIPGHQDWTSKNALNHTIDLLTANKKAHNQ